MYPPMYGVSMSSEIGEPLALLKWDKKFEFGLSVIDAQHKHLVYLCNKLRSQVMTSHEDRDWQVALSSVIREAVHYIQNHFAFEEKLMQAVGFPEYAQHRRRHLEFVDNVRATLASFENTTRQTAIDFSTFLYNWFLQHIAYEDTLYVAPIKEYSDRKKAEVDMTAKGAGLISEA